MSLFVFPAGYVGLGTVGAATWWYLFDEDGPQVSFYQLVRKHCSSLLVVSLYLPQHSPVRRMSLSFCYISICSSYSLLLNTIMYGDPSIVQK